MDCAKDFAKLRKENDADNLMPEVAAELGAQFAEWKARAATAILVQ